MSKPFWDKVDDIPVSLEELTASNRGKVHVLGVTPDTGFDISGIPGDHQKRLRESVLAYGGQERLGKDGTTQIHEAHGDFYVTVGLGESTEWKEGPKDGSVHDLRERLRLRVGDGVAAANGLGIEGDVSLFPLGWQDTSLLNHSELIEVLAGAAMSSSYQQIKTTSPNRSVDSKLGGIHLLVPGHEQYKEEFRVASIIGGHENTARFLFEAPHDLVDPEFLANHIIYEAGRLGLGMPTIQSKENIMSNQNNYMEGLKAVARGSPDARYITLMYNGRPDEKGFFTLIGKGLTFDSGGMSIKPGADMDKMNGDMGGAATSIQKFFAAVELGYEINLALRVPICENKPGMAAYNPGSTISLGNKRDGTPYDNRTLVLNTDAEGRLVMLTAIIEAALDMNTLAIMDDSTLTGAMMNAHGNFEKAGIIANPHNRMERLIYEELMRQGDKEGQPFAHYPVRKAAMKRIKDPRGFAGMVGNIGQGPGSARDGDSILRMYADGIPFVHIDMAPTLQSGGQSYHPNTIFGTPPVRAQVKMLEQLAKQIYKPA
ncbi:MAG: hypothetical protein ABIH34_02335 [Nanoarchaeota archaeon]